MFYFMLFIVVLAVITVLLEKHLKQSRLKPLIVPQGDNEIHVYTYNGLPVKRYALNEPFLVEVISEVTHMKSVYTDTEWTGRFGVKAGGLQFGFAEEDSILLNYICNLANYYSPVKVHAANVWGLGKTPYIVLQLPDQSWFISKIKEAKKR